MDPCGPGDQGDPVRSATLVVMGHMKAPLEMPIAPVSPAARRAGRTAEPSDSAPGSRHRGTWRQGGHSDERDFRFVDGRLDVQPLDDSDEWRRGELVSPDPTSVWPRIVPIREVWVGADDQTLVVGGLHGFSTVLHSLDVDESDEAVGLLARIAFTQEAARRRVEASEQLGEAAVGIGWSAKVRLQNPVAGRKVIDRGLLQLEVLRSGQPSPLHARVITHLENELAATPRPAERRRIRKIIKAIRRNPDKVVAWMENQEADEGGTS